MEVENGRKDIAKQENLVMMYFNLSSSTYKTEIELNLTCRFPHLLKFNATEKLVFNGYLIIIVLEHTLKKVFLILHVSSIIILH